MTNLDSILKSRDITLPTKVRVVKAMVFPVVMYGCGEGNGNHSSTLAWKIPETGELVGSHLLGLMESDTTEAT